MTRNTILLCMVTYIASNLSYLNAQDFQVQVAAFDQPIQLSYFSDFGVEEVKLVKDRFDIYHYVLDGYETKEEAEVVKRDIILKGFPNAQIIDTEVQNILCNQACGIGPFSEDMRLKPVFFDYNSVELSKEGILKIERLANILLDYPMLNAVLEGHTDAVGDAKYNEKLAANRIRSVRNYLKDRGIEISRLKSRTYGEFAPLAANRDENGQDLPSGRKYNRRVTLIVTAPSGEPIYELVSKVDVPEDLQMSAHRY